MEGDSTLPPEFFGAGSSFTEFLGARAPGLLPWNRPRPAGSFEVPHGTTIVALRYADGALIAGDRRVTMGNMIANRRYEKVFQADEFTAVGVAGSTGVAEEMYGLLRMELAHYEKIEGVALSLEGKANRLATLIRGNIGAAMQGLAVVPLLAGYDERAGRGRIYSYFVDGMRCEEHDFAATGSGSVFALGAVKKLYRPGLAETQAATLAVQALYDAADDDSATGGPDLTRRLYPSLAAVTADGFRRLPEEEVAGIARGVVEGRRERPDGPGAPVL
ncbi:Proteasome subunit beta [Streptomyces sp. RB5]|uniref:Proteasome subunit beta n=1 Tax=Streptomyces smaragdinus TaxID=2585196 RepID=A0A7K0CRB0_9ACTN|nr:proteasome subunit beta [Streptomyces smaragdinus]MQY15532.1 Proteasome subunit beta [Streptomyces smaragdinus]